MRQNIFFLSAVCFYFFIQAANLAFGAPADTDGGYVIVDLVDGDGDKNPIVTERNTQSLEKRIGSVRSRLGAELCDDMIVYGPGEDIEQLFYLYEAYCLDDKRYRAKCWEYIPHTQRQVTSDDECRSDEVCAMNEFRNAWGMLKTEVYCQKLEPKIIEVKANNKNIQQTNCSSGVTATPGGEAQTMKIDFAGLFYTDADYYTEAAVKKAWIQTNKKGIVAIAYHSKSVYAEVEMSKGETAQLCFMRETILDGGFGTFQWGFS